MIPHLAGIASALHSSIHAGLFAAAKTTTKKSSGSILPFILILVLGGGYFWMRSQRSRQRAAQAQQGREVEVGDEVTTNSGIIGRVHALHDDRVELEIAPGTVISVVRQAVGRRIVAPVVDEEDDHDASDPEDEHDVHVDEAFRPTELPGLHAPDEHQRHEHPEEEADGGLKAAGGTS